MLTIQERSPQMSHTYLLTILLVVLIVVLVVVLV